MPLRSGWEEKMYHMDSRVKAMRNGALYAVEKTRGGWVVTLSERLARAVVCAACEDCAEDDCTTHAEPPVDVGPFTRPKVETNVCGLCDGRGTVVDPAIDAGGLTRDDFADDPGFADDYFGGVYDMTCPECQGQNVTRSWADAPEHITKAIEDIERDDREDWNDYVRGY